jgi:hypothetical protein
MKTINNFTSPRSGTMSVLRRALAPILLSLAMLGLIAAPPAQADEAPLTETVQAINLTNAFWSRNMPYYYNRQWRPPTLPDYGYGANAIYDGRQRSVPCGNRSWGINNAFYCMDGNGYQYMGFDSSWMHDSALKYGDAFIYVLVAHEFGHAVQVQSGRPINELEADCLSGAALRGMVYDGTFQWDAGDYAEIDNTMKAIGASKATNYADPAEYGDWQQRYASFTKGYQGFARACF